MALLLSSGDLVLISNQKTSVCVQVLVKHVMMTFIYLLRNLSATVIVTASKCTDKTILAFFLGHRERCTPFEKVSILNTYNLHFLHVKYNIFNGL